MKHLYQAFCGALLVLGLAGVTPVPALAGGYHWDTVCNCRRPDYQYNTRRYVRGPTRVRTHVRVVNHTRVVRRTRLIQENRTIVHVRPVINRYVIVHRENTVVRNITLHKVHRSYRVRHPQHTVVINRYVRGSVRVYNEYRNVRGVNCHCGYRRHRYHGEVVSYRD